jgi:hypothetical protein
MPDEPTCHLRPVTPEEHERWTALAAAHGFVNEKGDVALGRFVPAGVKRVPGGFTLTLQTITPILAPARGADLQEKEPQIMFDRTEQGDLIFPGRWFVDLFEAMRDDPDQEDEMRVAASAIAKGVRSDVLLPAETETIAMVAEGPSGEPATFEALPPEGVISLVLTGPGG